MFFKINRNIIKLIFSLSVLGLCFLCTYFLLRRWEKSLQERNQVQAQESTTVTERDISALLIMGIDTEGIVQESNSYLNNGQCDFLAVLVMDEADNSYQVLLLNRDTMSPVQRLGINGEVADTVTMQLALAHTYGSGMEDSCRNTVEAVEYFLYGMEIDHYVSMNMSAVKIIVDEMGGIDVTINDDFSEIDAAMIQGETMNLNGEQCVKYIRSRKNVGEQTNSSRMERHKQFFYEILNKGTESQDVLVNVIPELANYMVTDLSVNQLERSFNRISNMVCRDIIIPEGISVKGEEYMEFYADEDALKALVKGMLYQ